MLSNEPLHTSYPAWLMDFNEPDKAEAQLPALSVVPTPIGNLEDITLRAINVLKNVDTILCEDTRRTKKLLNYLEIKKNLLSLHEHNETRQIPSITQGLQEGETMALLSDAGIPCLSDPGYRLILEIRKQNLSYQVLPGASAITTALVASNLPPHPFRFGGFLSPKKMRRKKEFSEAISNLETTLYFESPHRLVSSLELLNELSPQLEICVARELTKKFETIHRGSASELFAYFQNTPPKGEIVLLLAPQLKEKTQQTQENHPKIYF